MAKWKEHEPQPLPEPKAGPLPTAGELPPDRREPEPKHVPLVPEQGPDGPKDAPPAAPKADPGGPVPRVIHPNERSPGGGLRRYKVRATDWYPAPSRYILASGEDEARTHYLQSTGMDRRLEELRHAARFAAGGDESKVQRIDPPLLTIKELPD